MQTLKESLKTIALSLIALSLIGVAYAWTEPNQNPPNPAGGSTPVNTSSTAQIKAGNLQVNALVTSAASGSALIVPSGNVGIGTTDPGTSKLKVVGTIESTSASGGIKFPDGTMQTTAASGGGGIPSGAIMFFNLSSCPSGWSEATNVRGRYIVGLPSGGSLGGTTGSALSNLENRAVGLHTHGVSDPGHSHTFNGGSNVRASDGAYRLTVQYGYGTYSIGSSTTGISIQNAGSVAGTNAPYIQLLTCQKN